ncbi:MAG: delta-60 repeat domain-containing protein, partial [Bacteroidota bacterium]
MKNKIIILAVLLFTAFSFNAKAQPGAIDTTFNSTDIGFGWGDGANGFVYTSSIQSDGKIIIGGNFNYYNGTAMNRIARLNADGSLDGAFNVGTGANGVVETISIQSDGKIIIGGGFSFYNGTARARIARLNADGTLDNTFTIGTGANDAVETSSIQSDGKIIIGGRFTTYNGTARNRIARLNADGSLDAAFNPGTGANDDVQTSSIQSDGKI